MALEMTWGFEAGARAAARRLASRASLAARGSGEVPGLWTIWRRAPRPRAQAAYGNINDGYVEALVRGYRSGLLTAADYNNLSQCENLDDVKLHLVRPPARPDRPHAAHPQPG